MFVTNSRGNSTVSYTNFASTTDGGLRTLSGGQITLQIDGSLAIQDDAVPPFVVDRSRSVRDVFATMGEAPSGAPVELTIRVDGQPYCNLTIASGNTTSEIVDGLRLAPLLAGGKLTLDVVSVGADI